MASKRTYAYQFDVSGIVLGALAAWRGDVPNGVLQITAIRCYLIAQEDTWQLPVVDLSVSTIGKVVVNNFPVRCVQSDVRYWLSVFRPRVDQRKTSV